MAILGSIARERGGTTTMEHSDERRDFTLRFYEFATTGDLSFFDRHVSRQAGVVFVCTVPTNGGKALRPCMRR